MNDIQVKRFNDKLKKLEEFTQEHSETYSESEIIDWISACVNIFYEIGVDPVIVRHFLDYCNFRMEKVKVEDDVFGTIKFLGQQDRFENIRMIGPFCEEISVLYPRYKTGHYVLAGSFYYAKIAFSSARSVLKSKTAEKKIVPVWLIELTAEQEGLSQLTTSLELIEGRYEQRDSHGLAVGSITLLQSILNLDTEMSKKKTIGQKLNFLIENRERRELFGASEDLIRGLNCDRILRNEKVIHKDAPLKYDFPFMIATSFAYLVLFFLECAILNGKIIKYE